MSKKSKISPKEFVRLINQLRETVGRDVEVFHSETDRIMEIILTDLGYEEGIKLLQEQDRWYA